MLGSDNTPIKRDGTDRQLLRLVNDMLAEAGLRHKFLLFEIDKTHIRIELIKEPRHD